MPLEVRSDCARVIGKMPAEHHGRDIHVSATHRRQGLLSRMMAAELGAAAGRGEPLAALIAAEWPIYGRYGFGPAAEGSSWYLDARSAAFIRELPGRLLPKD